MTNKLGSANPNRIPQRKQAYKDRERLRLSEIYNYHKVPNLFDTSGQPNEQELRLLAKLDYQVIINLSIESILDGRNIREKDLLSSLKVVYIHLPVDYDNPADEDFNKFIFYLNQHKNKKMWIHCEANHRVSAFIYRYRRDVLNLPHEMIISDMELIWTPNEVWRNFLQLTNVNEE